MYTYSQARELVRRELHMQSYLVKAGALQPLNIPLLMGPVGGGKTSIARSFAEELELPFCAINSGENSDATDVSGVPVPSMIAQNRDASMVYMEWVLNRYAATACTEPVFLLFDDLDKAPPPVQSAMLGITANRMFRDHHIHPGTVIMGAGNRIDDDMYANEISESLRTRMTIIEMIPDVVSFSRYGAETGDIHPAVIGYLQYRPEHLYKSEEGVNRFPSPRGWWEASQHLKVFDSPTEDLFNNGASDNWRGIVERKCGPHIGNDFWAWYCVISRVDVHGILAGSATLQSGSFSDRRMAQFAAIFAISQELNLHGVKPTHVGLPAFVDSLDPEMRVAFVVQVSQKARVAIATMFPAAADVIMSMIVHSADGKSRLGAAA